MGSRHIIDLGEVGGEVVEAPSVVVVAPTSLEQLLLVQEALGDVIGGRLPPIVDDRTRTEKLEVLGGADLGRVSVGQDASNRDPVERQLLDAVDLLGRRDPGEVIERGGQVDSVDDLVPDRTGVGDRRRVADDERGAGAAEPREALPELERRVPGPGPSPRVVVVGRRATPVVEGRKVVTEILTDHRSEAMLVEASPNATFGTGTVVGEEHHHGVVERTLRPQALDQAADVMVGVRQEPGEDLLLARVEAPLVVGER